MEIKILSLKIEAFKGIKSLRLDLGGHSADLYGRNSTGKTSVYDAYLWLLFGKDSQGSAKFDVKPLNEDGTPRTGTDTEVEALLLVDGKEVLLRRVLHEIWKPTPGAAEPVYSRDETLCFIDDVPVKLEKEYQPFIASLIGDVEQFKLLSIHGHFMELPWERRRRYLVDAAGGSADEEILAQPEFASVPEILQGKTAEEAKKRLRDQLKRVKTELDAIPARLDELQKAFDPVTAEQVAETDAAIARCKEEMDRVNKELDGTEDVFARVAQLTDEIRRLNAKIERRKAELDAPIIAQQQELRRRLDNARLRRDSLKREAQRLEEDISSIDQDISRLQKKREALLIDWRRIDEEQFVPGEVSTVCPYCGQPLPQEKIQESRAIQEKAFHSSKETRLADVEVQGRTSADRILTLQSERKGVTESLERKQFFIQEVEADIEALEAQDAAPKPAHYCYEQDEIYMGAMEKLEAYRAEAERPASNAARDALLERRNAITDKIADLQRVYIRRDQAAAMEKRIRQLEDRRSELGAQVVEINGQITLLGDFTTAGCTVMESRINSLFHNIQWQLFEYLKDGTVKDCCNATLNGVDYSTNLNNGARINAGIEIIRVLSHSLGVTVPCFVDNAEAVNDLAYAAGQMIRLRVSEDYQLTITMEE